MRSDLPKVLHPLAGAPLLEYVVDVCVATDLAPVCTVVGHKADQVRAAFADREDLLWADQEVRDGTGGALRCAVPHLGDYARVAVLNGDVPLLRPETLQALIDGHTGGVSFLTAILDDATGYGRVIRDDEGRVQAIVEHRDATESQRAVREINAGIYLFDRAVVELLSDVTNDNAQNEYYLTDLVRLALDAGHPVRALVADRVELSGVNSPQQLAELAAPAQAAIQAAHIAAGVTITAPSLTWIEKGARIAAGTLIHPFSLIRRGVVVGEACEVGPYAHLREGTTMDAGAAIGNFVEVKKSHIGAKTKAKHLTYIGDAELGPGTNVGAGTVFCNYDGTHKHKTSVGANVFIGSGSMVVAPRTIGDGARTGAGSVVTRDVEAGQTVVGVPARPFRKPEE